jgi:alpha-galactosidase
MARARTAVALLLRAAAAYDNGGYAARPPLGWQSWCAVGSCGTDHCFDRQIRETADAMAANGMLAKGYEWIVLDDCWHPTRDDASGDLVPSPTFFPDGMKPVIDYVRASVERQQRFFA